ncbi:MAG TPA: proliferating cell nuclear antigen (pcna) [Candidatus Nanoarchaeia archaeon]|nr:proliferating cell nuclear antigen (pcna) [Candidatus Nanoarchaeia archaeon]
MKLTLTEPRLLKEPINTISELVNDVKLSIDKDKLELIAIDPSNVAMVVFRLLSSAFVEYQVTGKVDISISLDGLKQVLKRAKPSDTLIIQLDEDKRRLKLQLNGETSRTFNVSLLDLEQKEQKIPDLKFNARIEMNSVTFDEAIQDMDIISDSVSLTVDEKKFSISSEGNISDGFVEITDDGGALISMDKKEPFKARYSIEYLKKIIKGSRLADKVIIQFDKDYPLKVDYILKDKLQLSTILAPRVENY